jgi:hypothetical protein
LCYRSGSRCREIHDADRRLPRRHDSCRVGQGAEAGVVAFLTDCPYTVWQLHKIDGLVIEDLAVVAMRTEREQRAGTGEGEGAGWKDMVLGRVSPLKRHLQIRVDAHEHAPRVERLTVRFAVDPEVAVTFVDVHDIEERHEHA